MEGHQSIELKLAPRIGNVGQPKILGPLSIVTTYYQIDTEDSLEKLEKLDIFLIKRKSCIKDFLANMFMSEVTYGR